MTVRFHPPEDQSAYAEQVLATLVRAALPQILEQARQQEPREEQVPSTRPKIIQ